MSASVEERIQALCIAHAVTLATAESCTGGLVGHRLTNVPGSSAYFLGGIISYANAVKVAQLGVQQGTLDADGAVSEATVREMAAGAAARLNADLAVAISGIAGPDGGTEAKPVGLVHFALHTPWGVFVEWRVFAGDRVAIKTAAAGFALAFILATLEERYDS